MKLRFAYLAALLLTVFLTGCASAPEPPARTPEQTEQMKQMRKDKSGD